MSTEQEISESEIPSSEALRSFILNEEGLFWKESEDGRVLISGYVTVIANAQKPGSSAWSTLLELENNDRLRIRVLIPNTALVGDGDELVRQLVDRGLWVAPGRKAKQRLVEWLVHSIRDLKTRLVLVERTGWHEKTCFVFPDDAIGSGDQKFYYAGVEKSPFQVAGKPEEWKKDVGCYCSGNSLLCVGVSLGFAAPLLRLASRESIGLHFHTRVRTQPSTSISVLAS